VPRQKRHERILEVLKLVGLDNSTFQLYQKYSGGMKRKLALARTLLPDPPIIMLDEPTTGLDALSSRNIREFVKSTVRETDKTVLYTTHYIEEAAQICDKIGIMKQGKIVACDTPDALKGKIKEGELIYIILEQVSQAQIEQMRLIQGVIEVTEKNGEDLMPNQKGVCVELQSIDQLPSIFDYLFNQKIKLVNFKREEPSLEDAFIELTKRT
jgi:ABC-2 type transport system ATP-binding protein